MLYNNRITAETTDGQILAPITAAKEAMVDKATEIVSDARMRGDELVNAAQMVRNAEALARVQMQYRNVCAHTDAPHVRLNFLLGAAAKRDDTWSGRGNDSTRAAQDAVTEWATAESYNVMADARPK